MRRAVAVGAAATAAAAAVAACGSGGMQDAVTDPTQMRDLVAQGVAGEQAVTCTGKDEAEGMTVYIASADRMRVDVDPRAEVPSMLFTEHAVYAWVRGESAGLKVEGTASAGIRQSAGADLLADLSSPSDFDAVARCGVYTGDDAVFAPPKSVDFLTPGSAADFVRLESAAPRLVTLMD